MPKKHAILAELTRDELRANVDYYELEVSDRRVKAQLVDALARSRKACIDDVLLDLSRARLKALCRAFDLDDVGRRKADLVARLLGRRTRDEIQALTVHQPWAALIAAGAKRTENRDWLPKKMPRVIAIHAAKRRPTEADIANIRSGAEADPDVDWPRARRVLEANDTWTYERLVCLASLSEPRRAGGEWRWPIKGVYRVTSRRIPGRQKLWWVPVKKIEL